jgi:hypothetical protein
VGRCGNVIDVKNELTCQGKMFMAELGVSKVVMLCSTAD